MGKQAGLRLVGALRGGLGLAQFVGEAVAIQGGINNEVERARREREFVLRDG